MNTKPILFSAPMVRALLDGSKTQTRRICKPQPVEAEGMNCTRLQFHDKKGAMVLDTWAADGFMAGIMCSYGQPGDHLYVKETFAAFGRWETRFSEKKKRDEWHFIDMTIECGHEYRFDLNAVPIAAVRSAGVVPAWNIRPSIFMPLAASRITLEIVSVRVERLQDINEIDSLAEGIAPLMDQKDELGCWYSADTTKPALHARTARTAYAKLWESINGPGSWNADPFVWVIEFRRIAEDGKV